MADRDTPKLLSLKQIKEEERNIKIGRKVC